MINLFDYFFYRASEAYKKGGDSEGYKFTAMCITGVMQALNIAVIFFLFQIFAQLKWDVIKFQAFIFILLFIILNIARYNSVKYDFNNLKERWSYEDEEMRRKRGNFMLAYAVLSIVSFFVCVTYLGSRQGN